MQRYVVTTVAGREQSVNAPSAEAARLLRLDQMLDVLIAAEQRGEPRRFDWHALPREAREDTRAAVGVADLYGDVEHVRVYQTPSDRLPDTRYTVTLGSGIERCTCPGFVSHQKACKHIKRMRAAEVVAR